VEGENRHKYHSTAATARPRCKKCLSSAVIRENKSNFTQKLDTIYNTDYMHDLGEKTKFQTGLMPKSI